ncbi:MAG: NAD(P)-dependent oxidoreductase [Candidatus Sedimenticola endophacoides]
MRIAQLGLGLMGLHVALRLQRQGFEVGGWNRGAGRMEAARRAGLAADADLPALVRGADTLILTLSDYPAIQAVLFAPGRTLELEGRLILQMGTIGPAESRALAARCREAGAEYLEAPVLGSLPEAEAGTLIVMAGGGEAEYARVLPLLSALGRAPERVGGVGQAAALKLAMNQLIASLTAGFSLSLGLVRAEGLDVERFMALLRASALYAPNYDKKLGKMLAHDYASANFPLKHLLKDMALFRGVAAAVGIDDTLPAAHAALLQRGAAAGLDDLDYSSLYELINPAPPE